MIECTTLQSVELFAGAGGLALGVAKAGFNHVAVVDSDSASCETLRLNKRERIKYVRDWNIVDSDIRAIGFSGFRGVDLVSGGPPCQPFSQAGSRVGRNDPRDMFPQFIRAIRAIHPRAFIIENVNGLAGPSFWRYFTYLIHQLRFPEVQRAHREKWTEHRARLEELYTANKYEGLQYRVIEQSLNAADFGVGQRRNRVFIVGLRSDLGLGYSFPISTHSRATLWHDQWVSGEYWDRHHISKRRRPETPASIRFHLSKLQERPLLKPWNTVRDVINGLPNMGVGRKSRKVSNHFFNPGARSYDGHEGSSLDAPAKTIKAGRNGVPGGENMVRLDNGMVRYFSVRECARLQGFPDNWAFEGSWCSCMRQIGNAVPVTLGEVVARPLAEALRSVLDSGKKSL
jgi:DNA (cytosine-5)-methyltransferase 1